MYDFWTKWAISVQCIPTKILTAAFLYLPNKLSMTFYYKLLQKPKNLNKTHGVKTFARFFRQIKQTALFSIRILPISLYFFVKMIEKTQFLRIPRKLSQIDENFIGGFSGRVFDLTEKRCFIANFTLYWQKFRENNGVLYKRVDFTNFCER